MRIKINEELEIKSCKECPFVIKIDKGNNICHYFCDKLDKYIAYYIKEDENIENMEKECPIRI